MRKYRGSVFVSIWLGASTACSSCSASCTLILAISTTISNTLRFSSLTAFPHFHFSLLFELFDCLRDCQLSAREPIQHIAARPHGFSLRSLFNFHERQLLPILFNRFLIVG
jgi:hypothetical protein